MTDPVSAAAAEMPGSHASRLHHVALECPDELAYWHIALDGKEPAYTWAWLDRRSSQLAGALAERGLGFGDRLGIGLRNSPQFMISVFAAWKLGAVPVPVRWDLPDWELERVRAVIEPRAYLGAEDLRVDRRDGDRRSARAARRRLAADAGHLQ